MQLELYLAAKFSYRQEKLSKMRYLYALGWGEHTCTPAQKFLIALNNKNKSILFCILIRVFLSTAFPTIYVLICLGVKEGIYSSATMLVFFFHK